MLLRPNLLRLNNDTDLQLCLSKNMRKDIDFTVVVDKQTGNPQTIHNISYTVIFFKVVNKTKISAVCFTRQYDFSFSTSKLYA